MKAVATGASRGLGRTVARLLAEDGASLVVTARTASTLQEASAAFREAGAGEVLAITGDVNDAGHRAEVAAAVGATLDLLILNASTLGPSPRPAMLEARDDDFREVLETNFIAPLALARELHPALAAGGGRIVAVTSDASRAAFEGWGVYGASKAALDLAARTLAAERPDVPVALVDPGDLRTDMHAAAFPGEDIRDRPEPSVTEPFWRWLFEQPGASINGARFEAQAELWPTAEPPA